MKNLMKTATVLSLLMVSASLIAEEAAKKQADKRCSTPSFSSIDTNNSGVITLEELSKLKRHPGKKRHHGKRHMADNKEAIFNKIDSDADGEVTEQEFIEHRDLMEQQKREKHDFSLIDSNHSGVITLEEFTKKKPHEGKMRQHGKKRHDGKGGDADKIEHRFAKLDLNGDGEISEQEFIVHQEGKKHEGCKG